jgi:hypothetical protein
MSAPRSGRRIGAALVVVLGLLVVSTGCRVGSNPAISPVATGPRGTRVDIYWRGPDDGYWERFAELVAVADSGLFLLHAASVVYYPLGAPVRMQPREAPGVGSVNLETAVPEDLGDLAPYARYPFGLDDTQIERLVEAMGRDRVIVRREQ